MAKRGSLVTISSPECPYEACREGGNRRGALRLRRRERIERSPHQVAGDTWWNEEKVNRSVLGLM